MKPRSGKSADPLREARLIKRAVQGGVYGSLFVAYPVFYFVLGYSVPQVVTDAAVGMTIATVAIEGAFWQIFKLRKQSAYPNMLAVELGAAQDLQQACDLSTRLVAKWLDARAAVLAWLDEEGRSVPICSYGVPARSLGGDTIALADTPYSSSVMAGRAVLVRGEELSHWADLLDGRHYVAVVPLTALDRITAVLFLITGRSSGDIGDRKLLESIGMVIGLALENLRLTRREYQSIMQVLCSALDMRDSATEGHSQRVARMAGLVARQMGLPGPEVKRIEQAAALHDIGKIGIADAVLSKAGPLTNDEWVEMRRHPRLGYEIVAGIEALQGAAEIIHSHHEHYDGGGYPRGLKGEEIPLGARIFAVVDSYDAMTSHRPYRRARSHRDAIDEIIRCSGTQFDPAAVGAFLEIEATSLIVPHDSPDGGIPLAVEARARAAGQYPDVGSPV